MPGLGTGAGTAFAQGTHAARPAASAANQGYYYLETDTAGGTLFQSTGSAWVQLAPGVGQAGFGDPLTTKGDLLAHGTATTRLPVGADTQVLAADSAQALGVKWAAPGVGEVATINVVIDGGGAPLTTGAKGFAVVDFACSITGWTLLADAAGSAVVDVQRCTYAGFPATSSIAGTDLPTLSSAQKAQDSALSGWGSAALAAGDILGFVVNSASTVQRLSLALRVQRT